MLNGLCNYFGMSEHMYKELSHLQTADKTYKTCRYQLELLQKFKIESVIM